LAEHSLKARHGSRGTALSRWPSSGGLPARARPQGWSGWVALVCRPASTLRRQRRTQVEGQQEPGEPQNDLQANSGGPHRRPGWRPPNDGTVEPDMGGGASSAGLTVITADISARGVRHPLSAARWSARRPPAPR